MHLVRPVIRQPRCLLVMTVFHTYDWTRLLLPAIQQHLPGIPLLIVDNNPHRADNKDKRASYCGRSVYGKPTRWNRYCEAESDLIHKECLSVLNTPWCMDHGRCIDLAAEWAVKEEFDVLFHIEPDCTVTGNRWFYALLNSILQGNWMASGKRYPSQELHPTPSAWRLDVWETLGLSFVAFPRTLLGHERKFYFVVDIYRTLRTHQKHWDTGIYAWYRCARKDKAAYVPCFDVEHHYRGSCNRLSGLGCNILAG